MAELPSEAQRKEAEQGIHGFVTSYRIEDLLYEWNEDSQGRHGTIPPCFSSQ